MHGFLHIYLLNAKTTEVISDVSNLTLDSIYFNVNYLQILKDEGIDLKNRETLIKVSEIQFQLEKAKFPLVFHFFSTENFILIIIATHLVRDLQNYAEFLLEEIEQNKKAFLDEFYNNEDIKVRENSKVNPKSNNNDSLKDNHNRNNLQKSLNKENSSGNSLETNQNTKNFLFLQIISRNFAEYLIPSFLIPEKKSEFIHNKPENYRKISKFLTKICEENYKEDYSTILFSDLEGTWTIKEISEIYKIPLTPLRELLFFFWKTNIITFRMEYFPWDRFKTTIKAPLYLEEGSEENISLIDKFNSNKIIRLIETIGKGCSYAHLLKNFDITKTKLNRYLSELEQRSIIQREEYKPTLDMIPEDLIPLLSLQGFEKADFELLKKMAEILDGSVSIRSAALNLHVNPEIIKKLIDKYESAVKILT